MRKGIGAGSGISDVKSARGRRSATAGLRVVPVWIYLYEKKHASAALNVKPATKTGKDETRFIIRAEFGTTLGSKRGRYPQKTHK